MEKSDTANVTEADFVNQRMPAMNGKVIISCHSPAANIYDLNLVGQAHFSD